MRNRKLEKAKTKALPPSPFHQTNIRIHNPTIPGLKNFIFLSLKPSYADSGDRSRSLLRILREISERGRGGARFESEESVLGGQPNPKRDRSFACQGSEMLRRRQRSVSRYDGEVFRNAR